MKPLTRAPSSRYGLLLLVLCGAVNSCSKSPDFAAITTKFNASRISGVKMIELLPVYAGRSQSTLDKAVIIDDVTRTAKVLAEIAFPNRAIRPKAMGHSSNVAACKMMIHFNNGNAFAFVVFLHEGGSGPGVEYAIAGDAEFDSTFEAMLPGNTMLGRGFSIPFFSIIWERAASAHSSWIVKKK